MQKTCENHPKNRPKSMPKPSKNLQKIDVRKGQEKVAFCPLPRGGPGSGKRYKSTRHIRPLKKDTYREAHAERPT